MKLTGHSARLKLHLLPILVWLAVVACVAVLFAHRSGRFEAIGLAQTETHRLAPLNDGQIKSIHVQLFDKVRQNQTLVTLDDQYIQAQLATASAQIEQLMAQLLPTQQRLMVETDDTENDKITAHRRFSVDIENARLRTLQLKVLIGTDKIILEELGLEVEIVSDLIEEDAIAPYELQKVKTQYNAMAKKIKENEQMLEQTNLDLQQAEYRLKNFSSRQLHYVSVDNTLEIIHRSIKVQEQRIEELLVQGSTLKLTTPFDGIVTLIEHRRGETVLAGEPILTVSRSEPTEVVVFADENSSDSLHEGMVVELIKKSTPSQIASSQIVHLGSTIEQMPQRLWRNPNIAQWGRPFLVKIPPKMELLPGELVGVRKLYKKNRIGG